MRKIASIKNDLSLELIEGELIETSGAYGFSSNGDLTVSEIIESDDEVNKYLSFDGIDDTVENVGVNNFNWNEGTWEFWIRTRTDFANMPTSYYESFFGVEQLNPSFRLRVYARGSTSFYFRFLGLAQGDLNVTFPSSLLTYNEWTHVAITYDENTGEAKSYINGKHYSTSSFAVPSDVLTTPFTIGRVMSYGYLNADMKEFRVWDRALTESEIKENMNKSLAGNETGLVLYMPMNEGSGNIVNDKTGNGNDGMINGATFGEEIIVCDNKVSITSDGKLYVTELIEGGV